ncbi:MAG: hypothetical protein ABEJ23_01740 [Haloarculaceae archaeon]
MPSTSASTRLRDRVATQRNVTIVVAILVAVPTAYAVQSTVGSDAGGFLLLVTLAVGVPTAYDEYWPAYDRTWLAVAWVLAACAVAAVTFTALSLVGTAVGLSPALAAGVAFLVTGLGGSALLARRRG